MEYTVFVGLYFILVCSFELVDTQTVVATPTSPVPSGTPEDPISANLSLIIGVPVGVALILICLGGCLIWLACSAVCGKDQGGRTHSTNVGVSGRSNNQVPVRTFNSSSGVEAAAFQLEASTAHVESPRHLNNQVKQT